MPFHFKKFSVGDDHSSMRVGTDAVLLGAWINPGKAEEILDIGTGCGVIALMLAQKSEANITAIEIDGDSAFQASANFKESPWHRRMKVMHTSFQDFSGRTAGKFDLVVTNPPYFKNSLRPPEKKRMIARHDDCLDTEELIKGVARILSVEGIFYLVMPYHDADSFQMNASGYGLFPAKRLLIRSKPGMNPKRIAMGFGSAPAHFIRDEEIIIRNHDNTFTNAYRELTKEFYLDVAD